MLDPAVAEASGTVEDDISIESVASGGKVDEQHQAKLDNFNANWCSAPLPQAGGTKSIQNQERSQHVTKSIQHNKGAILIPNGDNAKSIQNNQQTESNEEYTSRRSINIEVEDRAIRYNRNIETNSLSNTSKADW